MDPGIRHTQSIRIALELYSKLHGHHPDGCARFSMRMLRSASAASQRHLHRVRSPRTRNHAASTQRLRGVHRRRTLLRRQNSARLEKAPQNPAARPAMSRQVILYGLAFVAARSAAVQCAVRKARPAAGTPRSGESTLQLRNQIGALPGEPSIGFRRAPEMSIC